MKKFVFSVILGLVMMPVLPLDAKEPEKNSLPFKYEVRVGYGGRPLLDESLLFSSGCCDMAPDWYDDSLSSIYGDWMSDVRMTGIMSAEFNFIFKKWLNLSLGVNYNAFYGRKYDYSGHPAGRECGGVFTFLPQVRFTYLSRPVVKLYSSVGIGVTGGKYMDKSICYCALQTSPIGIMVGKKVFGFAELGVGTMYIGAMAGVGVRF